jgi:hypothetical protein
MITTSIILSILTIFIIGFIQVYNCLPRVKEKFNFANEYRNKFNDFVNKYFQTYDQRNRSGNFDNESYIWLTMNMDKIQSHVSILGTVSYQSAFRGYMIKNYQVIINTIPKFRQGLVDSSEVGMVDDCLLRYLGKLEEYSNGAQKNLNNPIVWFREGFREVLSIPIFILNWLGIISNRRVNAIKDSLVYKAISGFIALLAFLSSIITIIVGYDQAISFISKLIKN